MVRALPRLIPISLLVVGFALPAVARVDVSRTLPRVGSGSSRGRTARPSQRPAPTTRPAPKPKPGTVTLTPEEHRRLLEAARQGQAVTLQPIQPGDIKEITLQPGQRQILERQGISRVAVVDPTVADVVPVGPTVMVLKASQVGETLLFLNHAGGRDVFRVLVTSPPVPDISQLASQVEAGINRSGISARGVGRSVILEGEAATEAERKRAEAIARAFGAELQNLMTVRPLPPPPPVEPPPPPAPGVAEAIRRSLNLPNINVRVLGDNSIAIEGTVQSADEAERIRKLVAAIAGDVEVVDLLTIPAPDPPTRRQVHIRTRVVDINRTKSKNLGFDFGTQTFTFIQAGGPFEAIFGGGGLLRQEPFQVAVTALINQGAARILSEPSTTVLEGEKGSILIGGEFPFPAVQSVGVGGGTASDAITIQFKEFGIRLEVEAQRVGEDDVVLRVLPEVSLLDFANAITISGFSLPSLRTRRAESTVRIQNGQTLAIGGLITDDYSETIKRVPMLSRIPVLGDFFQSKNYQRGLSELVILVTPEILGPGQAPSTVPTPSEIRRPKAPTPGHISNK